MLRKRNAFNICYINESKEILDNVAIVEKQGYKKCPALIFKSNGKQTYEFIREITFNKLVRLTERRT